MHFNTSNVSFCSFCGFDNPVAFSSIGEDDINAVEEYVKNDLITTIEVEPSQYTSFFGDFTKFPERFRFDDKERCQIKELVQNVKTIVDSVGAQHYLYDENAAKKVKNSAPVGCFFKEVINTKVDASTQSENHQSQTHYFLNKLLETANQNATRKKEGYRYSCDMQQWATYFRILAGPMAYETLQRNLEIALPAISSTNRYIRKTSERMVEGELRTQQLLNYLNERNLPLVVSLSEDGTRITSRIQYDVGSNQIVGFVLPTDNVTGMPIPYSYSARNINEIAHHFSAQHAISSNAIVVLAQPIVENVPGFSILIFGSDGSYTAEQVKKRWKFITSQLKQAGIEVISIASDSEPRYNAAMRRITSLGSRSNIFPESTWFNVIDEPFLLCIQDILHILVKMRGRFLKTLKNAELLPFGPDQFIQVQHLQFLLDHFGKDEHLLIPSAIKPTDKQNIQTIKLIIDARVTNLLTEKLPSSRATVVFLQIMRRIND